MRGKHRHLAPEPIANGEQLATIKQLGQILQIRANRKKKLEAGTRELRRILAQKIQLVRDETEKAKAFEQSSRQQILYLNASNIKKTMGIADVLNWSQQEVSIKKGIERCYQACDALQGDIDSARFKLDAHLKVYKRAVIDYEKILIIKQELENQLENLP